MPHAIRPQRINHVNAVVPNFDTAIAHFTGAYGAELIMDMPQQAFHACLFEMGQVVFELFVPHDFLVVARLGPHYVGLEWQADMDDVRAALADHGVGTIRDIGVSLHTDPADCFGVSHEFYAGEFHQREYELLGGGRMKSAEYWRDEHPLGLTGIEGYTHVVEDIEAAGAFYRSFLSAEPLFAEDRPAIGGRAAGLKVADAVVELLTPAGEGWLAQQLRRQGEGILSTVLGVRDMAQARSYCTAQGIPLEEGTEAKRAAVPASANGGIMFEFSE